MDRDELHRRIVLLKEALESGKLQIPRSDEIRNSLLRIRIAPDGKVDPESVDSIARSMAGALAMMKYQEDLLKVPLLDVQQAFLDGLENIIGDLFKEMKERNANPHQVATAVAASDETVEWWKKTAPEIEAWITGFWKTNAEVVQAHLSELRGSKAIFGGDVFPSYLSNVASSVGLYMDTIVLPDPAFRVVAKFRGIRPKLHLYHFVKHALNALTYRELALADVSQPIVVFAPDGFYLDETEHKLLVDLSNSDVVQHLNAIFGKKFKTLEAAQKFMSKFRNESDLLEAMSAPDRLLFDIECREPLADQIRRFAGDSETDFGFRTGQTAGVVYPCALGRMLQANETVMKSTRYQGTPLIDAPTSWQYLLWKYEYDCKRQEKKIPDLKNLVISKALQIAGSDRLGLLSKVPPKALIELRKQGALRELREILHKGLTDIDAADERSIADVARRVIQNLEEAFDAHQRELKKLSSARKKFFGLDIAPWIVTGTISIASAASGNIPLAVVSAALGTSIGAPSARDVWERGEELLREGKRLKRSPAAIFLN